MSVQGFRDEGLPGNSGSGDAAHGNGNGHAAANDAGPSRGRDDPPLDAITVQGDSTADQPDLPAAPAEWPAESAGSAAEPSESAYDLLQRGTELLRDRHNAQAAVVLERASRLEQGKGSILEALGRAYFNSGQHARAAETFEALLEVDPSAHYGHFALGLSFARLGRAQEAKTHLRLAVALQPTSETYQRALDKLLATEH
jgi:tetratricopeptide (TPR) repeat protein